MARRRVHLPLMSVRLVIMFGDVVLPRLRRPRPAPPTDVMISTADVARDDRDDRRGHVAYVGRNGDAAEVADDYTIETRRQVNVTRTLRAIRASAEHIDLSGKFMPVPGSDEYSAIMSLFGELPGGIV